MTRKPLFTTAGKHRHNMFTPRLISSRSGKISTQGTTDNEPKGKSIAALGCVNIHSAPQQIECLLAAFEEPANDLERANSEHEDFSDIVRTRLSKLGVL
jgi:hypothetical protein